MLDDPPRSLWPRFDNDPNVSSITKWWDLNLCYLGINTKHEKTSNYDLRRAIRTAIDRKQLIKLYHGTARPTYSLIPEAFAEYDPDFRPDADFATYEDRINAAKKLVKKANAKGKKLTIYYPSASRSYLPEPTKITDKIRQQLNKIGLDVSIEGIPPWNTFQINQKWKLRIGTRRVGIRQRRPRQLLSTTSLR